ncbi:hypothetical protein Tco_0136030 [Tanacetum coccineum]
MRSRVEEAETRLEQRHIRQNGDRVGLQRAEMTEQDVEVVHTRAEAAEQLHGSLRVAQMDITDLRESRRADRLEMAELRSRAQDIEARLWEIKMHFGI